MTFGSNWIRFSLDTKFLSFHCNLRRATDVFAFSGRFVTISGLATMGKLATIGGIRTFISIKLLGPASELGIFEFWTPFNWALSLRMIWTSAFKIRGIGTSAFNLRNVSFWITSDRNLSFWITSAIIIQFLDRTWQRFIFTWFCMFKFLHGYIVCFRTGRKIEFVSAFISIPISDYSLQLFIRQKFMFRHCKKYITSNVQI